MNYLNKGENYDRTAKNGECSKEGYLLYLRAAAAACLCAVFLMAQSGGITTKDPKAKAAVDAAIKALGGADKIGEIKSLVIKGKRTGNMVSTSWSQGGAPVTTNYPVTYDSEIRILLPDNFIRIDHALLPDNIQEIGSRERTTYSGVSQGKLLSPPMVMMTGSSGGGNIQTSKPDADTLAKTQASQVNSQMAEWSRFLIGTLAKAGPVPLTLSPGSTPGVFTLTKTDGTGIVGEIEFDPKTGYPSVVRTGGGEGNKPKPDTARPGVFSINLQTMDGEIRFRDRFSVNGIMFPRIIDRKNSTMAGPTNIEMRIEDVQINPNLSLKDFEVPK